MRSQSFFSRNRSRLLLVAGVAFFLASTYLCVTRLFNMSFTREPYGAAKPGNDDAEINLSTADLPMSYGAYKRPSIDKGMKLLANLPEKVVPSFENGRRLVVVGDIHGMDEALEQLLNELRFDTSSDHLVAVGDMVSKGPDSPGVISRLMKLGASAVRGNHEDRVLLAKKELDSRHGVSAELATPEYEEARGSSKDKAIAKSLSKDQLDWIAKLPVILTAQPLPIIMVHAGLVPNLPLHKQDPWAVMNVRTLVYPREALRHQARKKRTAAGDKTAARPKTAEPTEDLETSNIVEVIGTDTLQYNPHTGKQTSAVMSEAEEELEGEGDTDRSRIPFDKAIFLPIDTHEGEKWSKVWDKYQKRLRSRERRTVIYGHDAKVGYKEGKYTFGLDSGCSRGGALTALVITGKKGGGFNWETKQVKCEKS